LLAIAPQVVAAPAAAPVHLRRDLAAMGTWLEVSVEAPDRAAALSASEAAVRAIETAERRLSTWRDDSELAALNRAPAGEWVEISAELARDLARVERFHRATHGAFDPGVGALISAWGLRIGGRIPTQAELDAARVEGGLAAGFVRDGARAMRRDPRLAIEEGGFGKGIALDAALEAARAAGAISVLVDLGGQIAVDGAAVTVALADPRARERAIASVSIDTGSLATSGNSERGITVGGARLGHLLDPRSGAPARDFGSLAVWSADATAADCLSTGLYVLGPDAALAWARDRGDVEVVALEPVGARVRVRATPRIARTLVVIADDADLVPAEPSTVEGAAADAKPRSPGSSRP
jgi:thiamine biosynthesis lipoprotein